MPRWYALVIIFIALAGISRHFSGTFSEEATNGQAKAAVKHAASHSRARSGDVVIPRAENGHFYTDVEINGTSIHMMADTGASVIALSVEDAESAGVNVGSLDFSYTVSTANGNAEAAVVMLDEVSVGGIERQNVRALVARGLSGSLLGMSFFGTLSKVSMESGELVLED